MSACSDDYAKVEGCTPSTTRAYYNFYVYDLRDVYPASGGTKDFELNIGYGVNHSFVDIPSWLALTLDSKQEYSDEIEYGYNLTASPNYSSDARMGIFTCKMSLDNWKSTVPFEINQLGQSAYIYCDVDGVPVSSTTYENIPADGGIIEIPIFTNNPELRYSCDYSDNAYYSYQYSAEDLQKQIVDVDVLPNTSTSSRSFSIYIYSGSKYVTVKCYQLGQSVDVTSSVSFPAEGGTKLVQVNASSQLTWTVSCNSTWLQAQKDDSGYIVLSAISNTTANARISYVYVNIGNSKAATIAVTQSAPSINLSPAIISSDYTGQQQTVTVTSDFGWEVMKSPEWCTVSPLTGKAGATQVTITPSKNDNLYERQGEIVFGKNGWSVSSTLTVRQSAFRWGVDKDVINFAREASSNTVKVDAVGEWVASAKDPWVTLTPVKGQGASELTISVSANNSAQPRTTTVTVDFGGAMKEITVYQEGYYLSVDGSSLSYDCNGGSTSLYFGTNLDATWSVMADDKYDCGTDWVTFERESDGGSDYIAVTTAYNNSAKTRGAYLMLKPNDPDYAGMEIRIPVTQTGRTIVASVSQIAVFYKAGDTDEFTVTSDGDFTATIKGVSDDNKWVSISYDSGNVSKITQQIVTYKLTFAENPVKTTRVASLVLALSDLPDGETYEIEIPIIQYGTGVVIGLDGWGSEHDWNAETTTPDVEISLDGWGDDNNWNY